MHNSLLMRRYNFTWWKKEVHVRVQSTFENTIYALFKSTKILTTKERGFVLMFNQTPRLFWDTRYYSNLKMDPAWILKYTDFTNYCDWEWNVDNKIFNRVKLCLFVNIQFVKGKGFFVCDVWVAAHTQNCPKNGPLKARLMAWAAKLREKIINPFISLYFKPLFLVFISVLSKLSKESLRQGGLRCCSLENISAVLPALKKSWNRI